MRYVLLLTIVIVLVTCSSEMIFKKKVVPVFCPQTVTQKQETKNICFNVAQCTEFGNAWMCKKD